MASVHTVEAVKEDKPEVTAATDEASVKAVVVAGDATRPLESRFSDNKLDSL